MVHAIKLEWIFLQIFTENTGDAFAGVEKMLRENFLPRLFLGKSKTISPIVGTLSKIPVKKSGLGLLNAVTPKKYKYLSFQRKSKYLILSVMGGGAFSNANQILSLREERRDGQKTGMTSTSPNSRN